MAKLIGAEGRRFRVISAWWSRRLAGMLTLLSLAIASAGCGGAEVRADERDARRPLPVDSVTGAAAEPESIAFLPSGFGTEYDRAVARMIRTNHLLEERQADLFFAKQEDAPRTVIADLRRQVAALEQNYAKAITAMTDALRCKAYYCPEGARR